MQPELKSLKREAKNGEVSASMPEGAARSTWLNLHHVSIITTMFLAVVALNIADLWTSAAGQGLGLTEGNDVVWAVANLLGLQIMGGLALTKLVGIAGGLVATLFGIRVQNPQVRETAVTIMAVLTLLLLAVTVNNLYVMTFA